MVPSQAKTRQEELPAALSFAADDPQYTNVRLPCNFAGRRGRDEPDKHSYMCDVPKVVEFVEGLLGWIHERPEMYCRLAGELDAVMYFLHLAWAEVKDRT